MNTTRTDDAQALDTNQRALLELRALLRTAQKEVHRIAMLLNRVERQHQAWELRLRGEARVGGKRGRILRAVLEAQGVVSVRAVSIAADCTVPSTRTVLGTLARDGFIRRVGPGMYASRNALASAKCECAS